jgi:hypothetical protein
MHINRIARYVDDRRVQLHLRLAELELRQRNVSRLSQAQQHARMRQFDSLRGYWQQGIFPHNINHKHRQPVFIDPGGRVCAVAHLVIQSGHEEVAQRIHIAANAAYVRDMPFPELDQWAQVNGLTREELARIQPTYEPTVSDPAAFAALMSTANNLIALLGLVALVGVWLFIMNLYSLFRRINTLRWAALLTSVGIAIGLFTHFIVRDLLNGMSLMLDYGGMSYATRGNGLQIFNAILFADFIVTIGAMLAGLGLTSLVVQYAVRLKNRGNKSMAIS